MLDESNFGTRDNKGYWKPFGKILRSEEHTSELQSRRNLVCRLLLEKKKKRKNRQVTHQHNLQQQ